MRTRQYVLLYSIVYEVRSKRRTDTEKHQKGRQINNEKEKTKKKTIKKEKKDWTAKP